MATNTCIPRCLENWIVIVVNETERSNYCNAVLFLIFLLNLVFWDYLPRNLVSVNNTGEKYNVIMTKLNLIKPNTR